MKTIILLLLLTLPLSAGWKKAWFVSIGGLVAANAADIHSSQGGYEANPFLRGPGGQINTGKAIAIKAAIIAAIVVPQALIHRDGRPYRAYTIINSSATAGVAFTASRNYRIGPGGEN